MKKHITERIPGQGKPLVVEYQPEGEKKRSIHDKYNWVKTEIILKEIYIFIDCLECDIVATLNRWLALVNNYIYSAYDVWDSVLSIASSL